MSLREKFKSNNKKKKVKKLSFAEQEKKADILNQKAEEITEITEKEENFEEFYIFETAGNLFGIELKNISEIISVLPVTPVPLTKPFLIGLFNLRNTVYSLFDLPLLMGIGETDVKNVTRYVILKSNGIESGILIEKSIGIKSFSVNDIIEEKEEIIPEIREYTKKVLKYEGKLIPVLNIDKIFQSEEFLNYEVEEE